MNMTGKMKFSIITINYNNKEGLRKTIESVVRQSFKDYEYIVIDGGSTDGSVEVIKEYASQIDYWVSEPDKGIYNAMNKGILQTHGEYLNFMNSGDCFHSLMVLSDVWNFQKGEDMLIGGCMNPDTKKVYIFGEGPISLLYLMKNTINHQATFYRRKLFDKRLYDESYHIQSDCKFNFLSLIFDNCSAGIMDLIVADYDYTGLSAAKPDLVEDEWQRLLHELFPKRVLIDYANLFTEAELPLVRLLPRLKNSSRIQRIVYFISERLLKFAGK